MAAQLAAAPRWQGIGYPGVSGRGSPTGHPYTRPSAMDTQRAVDLLTTDG